MKMIGVSIQIFLPLKSSFILMASFTTSRVHVFISSSFFLLKRDIRESSSSEEPIDESSLSSLRKETLLLFGVQYNFSEVWKVT